jgi:hypothetical protein
MADAPVVAPAPQPQPGFAGRFFGMFNIFIDPGGAAKLIPLSWSWLGPLLVSSIIIGVCAYLLVPVTLHVMQVNPPGSMANMSKEQIERAMPMIELTSKIGAALSPLIAALMTAIFAGLLSASCAVMSIDSRYRNNFSLIAHGGLIGAIGYLAAFFVIRLKGNDIQSMQELRPGFGIDLLLPEGTDKILFGVANYFSIFTLWYIIMLTLTFAALTGKSKGKAFAAITPIWILGMILATVGALFSR